MQTQELISALADGQLRGEAFARGVELAATDPVGRETWHTYHLIGDVLRSGEMAGSSMPTAFLSRLQVRLRQEKQSLPSEESTRESDTLPSRVVHIEAANDSSFRWKLVAGFASVAAMAAIGWLTLGGVAVTTERGQLAVAPSVGAVANNQTGVMIRDARLDEFLAAHRQHGGASALQTPAGFLRNATFEGSGR